jgi:hypothetical protein
MTNRRRISEFLPEVLQTDVLQKFFAATGDHLFQPGRVEYLSAYIGQRPKWYDPLADQYVREPTKARQDLQVEPGAVSRDTAGNISHLLSYDDLINKLRFQGALVNDQNRLFSAEYYSWGLPVDLDKFVNYQNYVWLSEGPATITLLSSINSASLVGLANYTYTGLYQFSGQTEIKDGAVDPLVFSSGQKVMFAADVDLNQRSTEFIVEGVGTGIFFLSDTVQSFLAWDNPENWDSTVWDGNSLVQTPSYVLIGRGSVNRNPWSLLNRWFHRSVVEGAGQRIDNTLIAQRPILEFDRGTVLWNYATNFRGMVNLIDSSTTNLNTVIGASSIKINGVELDDGMTVLFTNLRNISNPNILDSTRNNRIYLVTNIRNENSIVLVPLANGDDPTGAPVLGDGVWILQGDLDPQSGKATANTQWRWNGQSWTQSQSPLIDNTRENGVPLNPPPLFDLFDANGNSIADPAVWPSSDFAGSTLLSYAEDSTAPVDSLLGISPSVDQLSARNYVFDVTAVSREYTNGTGTRRLTIPGFKFWAVNNGESIHYFNNWFQSPVESRQRVVNQAVSQQGQTRFSIDQMPLLNQPGPPAIEVTVGTETKTLGRDFALVQDAVEFFQPLEANQFVQIKTWAGLRNQATQGSFELPPNLQANSQNQEIARFAIADVLSHLQGVIANQTGFLGNSSGNNNWRDTAKDPSLGTVILQHRAPMLRLMALNAPNQTDAFESSGSVLDPLATITWAQSEYLRFYNKTVNNLIALYNNSNLTPADSADQWLNAALAKTNLGKTSSSPWTNSGTEGPPGRYGRSISNNPSWIPPSATRLGVTAAWQPEVFFDTSQSKDPQNTTPALVLRGHNGALLFLRDRDGSNLGTILNGQNSTSDPAALTHPVAAAWLLFELRMFQSLPMEWQDINRVPDLLPQSLFSGASRTTGYVREEWLQLAGPAWQKWLTFNQLDAFRNTTYNPTDPFSWNYSSCVDPQSRPVPGHARGIFFWFYDTDTPHLTPWHMLGFSQKPSWWNSEYGPAPYTSGNIKMWSDLAEGRVAQGSRQGVHPQWARPQLLNQIPVNSVGQLLPPFEAGLVTSLPSSVQASADWKFGDRSPLENVWLTTADSDFLWAQWAYLAAPARFIEYLWDGVRSIQLFANQRFGQWVDSESLKRQGLENQTVHGENPSLVSSLHTTQTYRASVGIQHWFSERLISDAKSVTNSFGQLLRNTEANLIHKLAGFTDSSNNRLLVDSFGLSTNDSLLLPQEDVTTVLCRSASIKEVFYSGVIVESRGRAGWRVIGYDSVNPFFEIIPSDTNGPRNTVVIDNQRAVEYKRGKQTRTTVNYGTVFSTPQEVYDFLISLGRAQEADGWIFDQYDNVSGQPRNWSLSAREFLFWSQGPWAPGTYIALSPLATLAKFKTDFGIITNVGGVVNGANSILDRNGSMISLIDVDFLRIDNEISARTLNDQGVFGLRLSATTLEHAFVFNNRTIFNDLVYDPLFNQRQARFKLFGYRTLEWSGRLDAPGYMVAQTLSQLNNVISVNNRIIPNFEKSVADLRGIFEIDLSTPFSSADSPQTEKVSSISQSVGVDLTRLAQHTVAYQPRPWLSDLLVNNSTAFQFYQGMIAQKGTPTSIDRLLRNTNVLTTNQDFGYFEEFAFRDGEFGQEGNISSVDVILPQSSVNSNPQVIELRLDQATESDLSNSIVVDSASSLLINQTNTVKPFALRTYFGPAQTDLPTAGYVLVGETDFLVLDQQQLEDLYQDQINQLLNDPTSLTIQPGNTVWQAIDNARVWNVLLLRDTNATVISVAPNAFDSTITTVSTVDPHGLRDGDLVIMFGTVNAGVNIDGSFVISNVTPNTFNINFTVRNVGSGGTIWVYRSVRFNSIDDRDSAQLPGGWTQGDLAYVDGTDTSPWTVWRFGGVTWSLHRQETLSVDVDLLGTSQIYNSVSLNTISNLTLWNPIKNRLPGVIAKEITFSSNLDPASYTNDPSGRAGINPDNAWGSDQVGALWWDLNTTRFLNYEIGSLGYSRQYWGSIVPGTGIDIYEWVRSPVPPTGWQGLVASRADLSAIGSSHLPSGEIRNSTQPYVTGQIVNRSGQTQTVYYFWVKNSTTVPEIPNRSISASVIAASISNPQNLNLPWWSPVNGSSVLLGNIGASLNASQSVWQTTWYQETDVGNSHKEWILGRPGDPRSSPAQKLWQRMTESLIEYNNLGDTVPNLRLKSPSQLGILIRPLQTMFENGIASRQAFVNLVNTLLASAEQPPAQDPARSGWQNLFEQGESEPDPFVEVAPARVATTNNLVAYYNNGKQEQGARLFGQTTEPLIIDGLATTQGDRILIKDQINSAQNGVYVVVNPGSVVVNSNVVGIKNTSDQGVFLSSAIPQQLTVEGLPVDSGDQLLLNSQTDASELGLWTVVNPGSTIESWILLQVKTQQQVDADPDSANWSLIRASDFDSVNSTVFNLQIQVIEGVAHQSTTWHQTNANILELGVDPVEWSFGPAPRIWDQTVDNLAQVLALSGLVNDYTRILVPASEETANRWTIWEWAPNFFGVREWSLVRFQSWNTSLYWELVDWYALTFDPAIQTIAVVETLAQRDAILNPTNQTTVRVQNTGSGQWAIYQWSSSEFTWLLVGQENGSLQLKDSLWDNESNEMGFDGGGFDADYQGFEYDSLQELNQIIKGLWVGGQGTTGLLNINSSENEPNAVFYNMINHVLATQTFVDWVFKTSFINLRGFAQKLEPTPVLVTNKSNSLLEYVNETKPYHVQIRNFVDWRVAQDSYQSASSDFDRPPYVDPNQGPRILDSNNSVDQILLAGREYRDWYQNFQTNPELIRKIRTRMIFDRVACDQKFWFAPGWTLSTPTVDQLITDPLTWADLILSGNAPEGRVVQVQLAGNVTLIRNSSNDVGVINRWNLATANLLENSDSAILVRNISDLLIILNSVVPTGYVITVEIDDLQTWNRFRRNALSTQSLDDWDLGAYQHFMGTVDRIVDYYEPTGTMLNKKSPLLISGCAGSLSGLDGENFQTEDSWDTNSWDDVRGWDFSENSFDVRDQLVSGGSAPSYWIFKGDGQRTQFGLPSAPQDPNQLKVWVNGVLLSTPSSWKIFNQVESVLPASGGLGYAVNDQVSLIGGVYPSTNPRSNAEFEVQSVDGLGAVQTISIVNAGSGFSIGETLWPTGGSGITQVVLTVDNVGSVGQILSASIASSGTGYTANDLLSFVWSDPVPPAVFSAAVFKVTGVSNIGAIESLEIVTPGRYMMVPSAQVVGVSGGSGSLATVSVRWAGRVLEFNSPPSEPSQPRPNVWVAESGSTFAPALSGILNVAFDGGTLNRPHQEGGHPEELNLIWPRSTVAIDVYTQSSAGWGTLETRSYNGDGITDQFLIGQDITVDSQLFVYVNGTLAEWGLSGDYVISYESMSVVFHTTPPMGRVNIVSVGFGGASKSLGSWSIADPGRDYNLYDTVTLSGGIVTSGNPVVQITAVKAVDVIIADGGSGYRVGDVLIYKYGLGSQTLSLTVSSVGSDGTRGGIITGVIIDLPGYYTNLTPGLNEWFTSGSGVDAVLTPSWGAANLFLVNRGVYFHEPNQVSQFSVVPPSGLPATGNGLELWFGRGHIREQIRFEGDGQRDSVKLSQPAADAQILVTWNGEIYTNFGFDSGDIRFLVFGNIPQQGDVIYVTVYNSAVFSLNRVQNLTISLPTLDYVLITPPGTRVPSSGNVLVYKNGERLNPPHLNKVTGDGTAVTFAIGMIPSSPSVVTVWVNNSIVPGFDYLVNSPSPGTLTFLTAPLVSSEVVIQVADAAIPNFDYLVSDDTISFGNWAVNDGDLITAISFTEDSQTSWENNSWPGTATGVYNLTANPASHGSVQVWVDGILATLNWDYQLIKIGSITQIQFGTSAGHGPVNTISAFYPTRLSARPPVAMRMFANIFEDTAWFRLSDQASTRLTVDLLTTDSEVVVDDGRALSDASLTMPGVAWIGSERVEYTSKILDSTLNLPWRTKLAGLNRGSMGTPGGSTVSYVSQSLSGDGQADLFQTTLGNPTVFVNNRLLVQDTDYQLLLNPPSSSPGLYVKFAPSKIPPVGSHNILFVQSVLTLAQGISAPAGTLVRDASLNQLIPGSYRWPYGNVGIQYGSEPQTQFLIEQPGTRLH